MSRNDFVGDAKLIPRLKEYLRSSNLLTAKAVNILSVADDLQVRYRDYARKKKDAFRIMVQKAYTVLQKDLKTDAIQSDESEASFSSDTEKYVSYESPNTMNRGLQNMYKKVSTPVDGSRSPVSKDVSSIKAPVTKSAIRSEDANSSGVFVIDRTGDRTNAGSGSQSLKRKDIDIMEEVPRKVSPMATRALLEPVDYAVNSPRENNMDVGTPQSGGIDREKTVDIVREMETSSSTVKVRSSKSAKANSNQTQKSSTQSGRPAKKTVSHVQQPTVTFADIGGNKNVLKKLYKLMVHFRHHLVHDQLGVRLPRGLLLHGPPGCGKTMLANAIAGELKLPFLQLAATEIVSGVSGESEEKVREMFDEAVANSPCVLFIDEIDSITPKREVASKDMERRIVTQLLTCMDGLQNKPEVQVLVIGATNRPDSLDSSLRRAGRFDREIAIGIPDEESRMRIIEVLTRKLKLEADFSVLTLARNTPGYVGADLVDLVGEATMMAVDRVFKRLSETRIPAVVDTNCTAVETTITTSSTAVAVTDTNGLLITQSSAETLIQTSVTSRDADMEALLWLLQQAPMTAEQVDDVCVTMADFDLARQEVQPSSKREGFATIPGVTWDDVGSLKDVREELQMAILAPVRYPEQFRAFGVRKASGILLIGPPGCGKTLLAKAIANESGINFISVKGPELFNMYVGESERAVRQVFQRARNSAPCLIFFDELDALCPDRNSGSEGGAKVQVVNTLLTEMDGAEDRQQVFVMGATNKPDNIDDAMLRPGRLGKVFYVGLPTEEHRLDILQTVTRNKPKLAADVSLEELAAHCVNFSGADLTALVEEASLTAIREVMKSGTSDSCVHKRHFDVALTKVRPSVTDANRLAYEKLRMKYCKPTGLA